MAMSRPTNMHHISTPEINAYGWSRESAAILTNDCDSQGFSVSYCSCFTDYLTSHYDARELFVATNSAEDVRDRPVYQAAMDDTRGVCFHILNEEK